MTTSAFTGIKGALVTALASLPGLDGAVFANRLRPLQATKSKAVVVRMSRSVAIEQALGKWDWSTPIEVECYGRAAAAGTDPADLVDPLLCDVWAALMAPALLTALAPLGVAALSLSPQIEWDFAEGETPMASAVISLLVQHRTGIGSLTA
jgi:hypothetical protein